MPKAFKSGDCDFPITATVPVGRAAPSPADIRAQALTADVLFYAHTAVPTPGQWQVMYQDLSALNPGARYWLDKCGVAVRICCQGYKVNHYPGYENPGYASYSGVGYPVPVIAADLAYPDYGNGTVGVGGSSVILHEIGHRLDDLLDGAFGNAEGWCSSQGPWQKTWKEQDWSQIGTPCANNASEAFAEAHSLWTMIRRGTFGNRLNMNIDYTPILDFWDTTAAQAGWYW